MRQVDAGEAPLKDLGAGESLAGQGEAGGGQEDTEGQGQGAGGNTHDQTTAVLQIRPPLVLGMASSHMVTGSQMACAQCHVSHSGVELTYIQVSVKMTPAIAGSTFIQIYDCGIFNRPNVAGAVLQTVP